MATKTEGKRWDAIVVGSGIGGLACAAALAGSGRRVLVLEQHSVIGGLTQSFSRKGFAWDVGIHYLGLAPGTKPRAVLDWLSGGKLELASMGPVYDIVRFPGGFEIAFTRPEASLRQTLKERFPGREGDVDRFFAALQQAERSGGAYFALRSMPELLGAVVGLWRHGEVKQWWGRSVESVLHETVTDPRLRAVLAAHWLDYGALPHEGSFGMHATLMHHYLDGGYYPAGGAAAFARALVPAIEAAGGEVRHSAQVREILIENGVATGVHVGTSEVERAPRIFSDAGAQATVGRLLPHGFRREEWVREILSLPPSCGHAVLYLGLEGDIRRHGATPANYFIHESWDLDAAVIWRDTFADAPGSLFVSFPSLKDPAHRPGEPEHHTAEVLVPTAWDAFKPWAGAAQAERPQDYAAFTRSIARALRVAFQRHFPALAPLVVEEQLSTPLSMAAFTGAPHGASYGLAPTPRRFLSESLRMQTPLPGLFLVGQDAGTPGIAGAMMSGYLAAASLEPALLKRLA